MAPARAGRERAPGIASAPVHPPGRARAVLDAAQLEERRARAAYAKAANAERMANLALISPESPTNNAAAYLQQCQEAHNREANSAV